MTIEINFFILIALYVCGAVGALLFRKNDQIANWWSGIMAIIGSLWGIVFAINSFLHYSKNIFTYDYSVFPLLNLSFHIDQLSAFFIFIISLIALFCSIYGIDYAKHFYKKYDLGVLGFFYHLFIAGMLLVVSATNGLLFLIAWEIMAVASYFLVVYDRENKNNIDAGFLYLIMTHVGTAFIVLAFLIMYVFAGSFDFTAIKAGLVLMPDFFKNTIFVLALIGFGTKAGIIPVHIWLPSAHPAAPSHISALMSGVMIKTGIYMMIRIFFDMFSSIPLWWGIVVLIVGATSALLGVLYALTEHDLKRLLAYHSIENIGIILLGLGSSLIFYSLGNLTLAIFSLAAALFHILNHAVFKALLFLSAGSVISQTHTRNIEKYGGLIKYMPLTAFFFLIGSVAISGLPPFNGFFSEWMTFQSLLQGIASTDIFIKLIFVLAAGSLALTGGLALVCFVKVFGATFLARPRSEIVKQAKESSILFSLSMGALATICLIFGIASGYFGILLTKISASLNIFQNATLFFNEPINGSLITPNGSAAVSAPVWFIVFALILILVIFWVKFLINKNQIIKIGATWDCGINLNERMEITATGFSRSIVTIFSHILRPSIQHEVEYNDSEMRFLPKSKIVRLEIHDVYQTYFYQPIHKLISILSSKAKSIQSGNINIYILYILITLIFILFLL